VLKQRNISSAETWYDLHVTKPRKTHTTKSSFPPCLSEGKRTMRTNRANFALWCDKVKQKNETARQNKSQTQLSWSNATDSLHKLC